MPVDERYHPEDAAHLLGVLTRLRALRLLRGMTLADVGAVLGVTEGAVSDVEIKPGQRQISSIQAFAHVIGHRVVFVVRGLAPLHETDDTVLGLLELADRCLADGNWMQANAYDRSALGALLRAHREAQGLTQQQLGARFGGRHKGNVQQLEKLAHNPLLGTLQTLARDGLGGVLQVRLVPEDPAAAAARIEALLDELRDYAVITGRRHKVTVEEGTLKGVGAHTAAESARRLGGRVAYSEVWLLRTGHEVLGPWREIDPAAAGTPQ